MARREQAPAASATATPTALRRTHKRFQPRTGSTACPVQRGGTEQALDQRKLEDAWWLPTRARARPGDGTAQLHPATRKRRAWRGGHKPGGGVGVGYVALGPMAEPHPLEPQSSRRTSFALKPFLRLSVPRLDNVLRLDELRQQLFLILVRVAESQALQTGVGTHSRQHHISRELAAH